MANILPDQSFVSVIVPVYNGSRYIERCLDALMSSSYIYYEIIVVDDCSTDDTVEIAKNKGTRVIQLPEQSGVAYARNFGVRHTNGDIVLFIDSDITVSNSTIEMVVQDFRQHPEIVAVFGSYDDDPAEQNFLSQYKNLFHHYNHQQADEEAFTFWAGCGAIRKKIFVEIGGFNQDLYREPCIEDIELGYRLCQKGLKIRLDKKLQVKHLKRWGVFPLLRSDILQRAIPWTRLNLETKSMPKDLNLKLSHKISSLFVALLVLLIPFFSLSQMVYYDINPVLISGIFLLILLCIIILNLKLYIFYFQKRGLVFTVMVIPLHIFYYFYSGLSFVYCWGMYKIATFKSLC